MASRLGSRLSAARHQLFVGREAERELFSAALAAPELPFHVLFVCGPGGVGKSSLLRELSHTCDRLEVSCIDIDGRLIDPSPDGFLGALRQALGLEAGDSPTEALAAQPGRRVLIIDTYEALAPLDGWLRDTLLPELPEDVLVVIAGRDPPAASWRSDPGWRTVLRVVPLRNLSPAESRNLLAMRDVPDGQREAILEFTHGHALALALVADSLAQHPESHFKPEAALDVVQALLQQFVQQAPGPSHRAALEACALVRVTSEPLLAELVGVADGHELFEWLRGLSFIEMGEQGLYPHDLAREALATDLRWRNPDLYAELHRRARSSYTRRLPQANPLEQQRLLIEYIFLHRHNPVVRPFFELADASPAPDQQTAAMLTEVAQPADTPAILAMVRQHEGEEAARLAARWLAAPSGSALLVRDATREAAGLLLMISLGEASATDLAADPAAAAATAYLETHGPLRSGERATLFRFWLARETYQAVSPVQSVIFVQMVRHYLTTPGLAFSFVPCSEPDFWTAVFTYADLHRLAEADFSVGGRCYGVYGHDWRTTPPMQWLELMAAREMAMGPEPAPPPATHEAILVLSEPDFAAAVQDALRALNQAAALRQSPLLRSRLVVERAGAAAGPSERASALRAMLLEVIEALRATPRDLKLHRVLHRTYVQPAATQEQAAEQLDLPFSTYRRHLKAGVLRVAADLWQRELGWLSA